MLFDALEDSFERLEAEPAGGPSDMPWRTSGSPRAVGGRLILPEGSEVTSNHPYSLRGSAVHVRAWASVGFRFSLLADDDSGVRVRRHLITGTKNGDVLSLEEFDSDGVVTSSAVCDWFEYGRDDIRYVKLRGNNGVITADVSHDGVTWTETRSVPFADLSRLWVRFDQIAPGESAIADLNVPENQLGDRIYAELPDAYRDIEAAEGFPLLKYLRTLAVPFDRAYQLTHQGEDPWSVALDPETCPDWALPWLATMAGVRVPGGMIPTRIRRLVVDQPSKRRGTLPALTAAIQATLSGTRSVDIVERDGSAYRLTIRTEDEETPMPLDTYNAIMRHKPAGIVLNYQVIGGRSWDDATGTWNSAGDVTWDSSSYLPV